MKYLSVCSGIESASVAWHSLGWEPVAFSEIEPFPCAVLKHHFPNVPNLGDMTKFHEWPHYDIDILVGGTPCQAFSIAGFREGLADPRGNLTLTFLGVAEKYLPRWVVWENVPGVLSDKTGAMFAFLDGLEQLGYVIDVDILDAQFHGVAQRRRRVFVCGQNVETILKEKTDSSALTIAQCVAEILRSILDVYQRQSGKECANLDCVENSVDGARRRMRLFGLQKDEHLNLFRDNLEDAILRSAQDQESSGLNGAKGMGSGPIMGGEWSASQKTQMETPSASWSTDSSWPLILDALLLARKLFTTSTAITEITRSQIFTCSRAALLIAKLIAQLNASSPCFWSAASSSFVGLKEYINYARSTNSSVFNEVEWVQAWSHFIREAEPTNTALGNTRIESFGTFLPVSESLRGNPPPSREARKDIAGTLASRTTGGGGLGTDFDLGGASKWPVDIAPTLNAHFGDKQGLEDQHALNGGGLFVPCAATEHQQSAQRLGDGEFCDRAMSEAEQWEELRCGDGGSEFGDFKNMNHTQQIADTLKSGGAGNVPSSRGENIVACGIGGTELAYTLRADASHSGDKGDGGMNTTTVISFPWQVGGR